MKFQIKLRRIGNSIGVYIPKDVITNYKIGDVITLYTEDVITNIKEVPIPTKIFNSEMCTKHTGSMKGTCGCK
jgi:antitoxin component of MazEF toxin-antitoxin module